MSRNKVIAPALLIVGLWFIVVAGALASTPMRGNPREPGAIPQENALYAAVIDTLYHPMDFRRGNPRRSAVLVQMQSVSGAQYLADGAIVAALHRMVPAPGIDSLLANYRKANAVSRWLEGEVGYEYGRFNATYLDTSTVRHILAPGDAEPMKESIVTDILAGSPLDSLPGILTLSVPGITPDANTALLFATLRERRSVELDHLEAAAFLILARDGMRWSLVAEVPVGGARY
jgi:hypothetical protein